MKNNSGLLRQSAIGTFWMSSAQVISQVLHMAVRLLLARLLLPADFGLIAMAMLVINFTYGFLDMGFGTALIQRKELNEVHKSTAYWANIILGLVIFGCTILVAPLVALFFKTNALTPLIICLSFNIVLTSASSSLEKLLLREHKFQAIALRQIWAIICGGITGLTLAWFDFGVWALVGESIVSSLLGTIFLFWRFPWRPSLLFDRAAFSELWQYSRPLIGARILNFMNRSLDTILIGRFLGAAPLGIYNLGYQFVLMPLIYVTRPYNKVLFTTLAKVQDDKGRLRKGYLQSLELLAFVTVPLMTMIALASPTLIPALLGEKWRAAIPLIPVFCLVGVVQSNQDLVQSVFKATGNTQLVLRWNIILTIVNALAFSAGVFYGVKEVAILYALATILTAPILQRMLMRILDLDWISLSQPLFRPYLGAFCMITTWTILDKLLTVTDVTTGLLMRSSLQLAATGAVYLFITWFGNAAFREGVNRVRMHFKGKGLQQDI
jgi:O-antigen/teichoic acid export membrane protein